MPYCSSCGSLINPSFKFCGKCGTPLSNLVNPNSSAGNFRVQDTTTLSRQLMELANNVDSLESVINQTEAVKSQYQIPEPRKPVIASRWWAMKGFVFGGIGAFVAAIYVFICVASYSSYISSGIYDDTESIGILVGAIILAVLLIGVGVALIVIGYITSQKRMENYNANSLKKYNAEVQKRNALLTNLQQQYNDLENSRAIVVSRIQACLSNNGNDIVIPERYFYSEAIRFFADRIATGRANSLSEAMDAYDAYIHRLKLEQAAEEAAEYQRQSANNLAAIQREQSAMRRQGAVNTALHVANTIRHW